MENGYDWTKFYSKEIRLFHLSEEMRIRFSHCKKMLEFCHEMASKLAVAIFIFEVIEKNPVFANLKDSHIKLY